MKWFVLIILGIYSFCFSSVECHAQHAAPTSKNSEDISSICRLASVKNKQVFGPACEKFDAAIPRNFGQAINKLKIASLKSLRIHIAETQHKLDVLRYSDLYLQVALEWGYHDEIDELFALLSTKCKDCLLDLNSYSLEQALLAVLSDPDKTADFLSRVDLLNAAAPSPEKSHFRTPYNIAAVKICADTLSYSDTCFDSIASFSPDELIIALMLDDLRAYIEQGTDVSVFDSMATYEAALTSAQIFILNTSPRFWQMFWLADAHLSLGNPGSAAIVNTFSQMKIHSLPQEFPNRFFYENILELQKRDIDHYINEVEPINRPPETILIEDNNDPPTVFNVASFYLRLGRPDKALNLLNQLDLASGEHKVASNILKICSLHQMGQAEATNTLLNEVLSATPKHENGIVLEALLCANEVAPAVELLLDLSEWERQSLLLNLGIVSFSCDAYSPAQDSAFLSSSGVELDVIGELSKLEAMAHTDCRLGWVKKLPGRTNVILKFYDTAARLNTQ